MRIRSMQLAAAVVAGAVALAACGNDDGGGAAPEPTTEAAPASSAAVGSATTELGEVLVDPNGLTLYGFTDDVDGETTCFDACEEAWPPVSGELALADDLDSGLFSTVSRPDGTTQLKAGDWPLYTFVGDSAPGDVNGQESGGVWFAITPDAQLIGVDVDPGQPAADESATDEPASDAPVASDSDLGPVLADADGKTLYVFTNDEPGVSTCNDPCSATWPPAPEGTELAGIDASRVGVAERDDGSTQVTLDGQPLYTFVDDESPGDVNGHGVGDVWFAVSADGTVLFPPVARIGSTDIGDVLIGEDGFTFYVFANDEPGVSTCNDPCSATWPPVPGDTPIHDALDPDQFGSATREDGTQQLTVNGQPLYRYVDDENPGDANGVLVGDGVWSGVHAADLALVDQEEEAPAGGAYGAPAPAAAAAVAIGETAVGAVLVDPDGLTLYGFTNDTDGRSACAGDCADAWPPVPGDTAVDPEIAGGADFSVITRDDGTEQLVVGRWPLYRFAGDSAPGDANGHGSGGVWFAVAPDGSLVG